MVATTAVVAAAAAKKTQHTSWVQTGLYLSYEIVLPNLHPHYDPAPLCAQSGYLSHSQTEHVGCVCEERYPTWS